MKAFFALALLATASAGALGDTYNFSSCTNTVANSANAGNTQLRMDVTAGTGRVNFTFYWVGTTPMSITDIYFDDAGTNGPGVLGTFGNSDLTWFGNVDFSQGASPANLPGGGNFLTSTNLSTDSNGGSGGGVSGHGVSTNTEWLNISIPLLTGKTFADVITALNHGFVSDTDRGLRVGLHVQSIGSGYAGAGGSESFINVPNQPEEPQVIVPLPAAAWTGLASLAGVGAFGWNRRKSMR